jgi:hypothetical protein
MRIDGARATAVGKPDHVAHNPARNEGTLGRSRKHQPVVIRKDDNFYRRNYYEVTIEHRRSWYWWDEPIPDRDPAIPPLADVPLCGGNSDDCDSGGGGPPPPGDDATKSPDGTKKPDPTTPAPTPTTYGLAPPKNSVPPDPPGDALDKKEYVSLQTAVREIVKDNSKILIAINNQIQKEMDSRPKVIAWVKENAWQRPPKIEVEVVIASSWQEFRDMFNADQSTENRWEVVEKDDEKTGAKQGNCPKALETFDSAQAFTYLTTSKMPQTIKIVMFAKKTEATNVLIPWARDLVHELVHAKLFTMSWLGVAVPGVNDGLGQTDEPGLTWGDGDDVDWMPRVRRGPAQGEQGMDAADHNKGFNAEVKRLIGLLPK